MGLRVRPDGSRLHSMGLRVRPECGVAPPCGQTVFYYNSESRTVAIEGNTKIGLGGKYSIPSNRDTSDYSLMHPPSGERLNITFEPPIYRGCKTGSRGSIDLAPIERHGW